MKEYIFENVFNSSIEIKIKAKSYSEALGLLGIATNKTHTDYKYTFEPFKLIS